MGHNEESGTCIFAQVLSGLCQELRQPGRQVQGMVVLPHGLKREFCQLLQPAQSPTMKSCWQTARSRVNGELVCIGHPGWAVGTALQVQERRT